MILSRHRMGDGFGIKKIDAGVVCNLKVKTCKVECE